MAHFGAAYQVSNMFTHAAASPHCIILGSSLNGRPELETVVCRGSSWPTVAGGSTDFVSSSSAATWFTSGGKRDSAEAVPFERRVNGAVAQILTATATGL